MKILYGIEPDLCINYPHLIEDNTKNIILPKYFYVQLNYLKNGNFNQATNSAKKIINSLASKAELGLLIFQTSSNGFLYFIDEEIYREDRRSTAKYFDNRNPLDRYLLSLFKFANILKVPVKFCTSSTELIGKCNILNFQVTNIEQFSHPGRSWLTPKIIVDTLAKLDPVTHRQWQTKNMNLCFNPTCQNIHNSIETKVCRSCGSKLLLGDRYRAIDLIGQSTMGRTFLAIDQYKPSKPRCTIEQLLPEVADTKGLEKASELFTLEIAQLDELGKHPQIPQLLAYFTQEGRQYLVQEFIEGRNLEEELRSEGTFSEVKIRQLLQDLLSVLDFIHGHQVIHRDIKPENIISSQANNKLFIVDFTSSILVTNASRIKNQTSIGSPEYVAPEQAIGQAVFASDLYSLGLSCIYLLTAIPPFNLLDSLRDRNDGWRHYLVNNPLSEQLIQILSKLVENDLNNRYRSAAQVLRDLNRNNIPQIQWQDYSQANSQSIVWTDLTGN
ncbi:MAG: serine/threonine-protein kinase [Prochloraceae cyanobacterium]|nr:serine/threonine-protein kinase [Prochloraceae cyanobacterium]